MKYFIQLAQKLVVTSKSKDIKASKLDILPDKIFQDLLTSLREKFYRSPYTIPTKKTVYSKIREVRGLMNMKSIQTVQEPPFCFKITRRLFSEDSGMVILTENIIK
ncbi:hypothetical protein HZS_1739 [Henneguya salminicola]|nr:hypothetical protein HZS_1739 [Henneguya salminicola]